MIYGCGIDIEEIERFHKHYFDKGKLSELAYDLFTSKEIENYSYFGKEAFLKGFCFKEAFYKAANNIEIGFKDIEVIFSGDNQFEIIKSAYVKGIFSEIGIRRIVANFQLNNTFAVCKVILLKE